MVLKERKAVWGISSVTVNGSGKPPDAPKMASAKVSDLCRVWSRFTPKMSAIPWFSAPARRLAALDFVRIEPGRVRDGDVIGGGVTGVRVRSVSFPSPFHCCVPLFRHCSAVQITEEFAESERRYVADLKTVLNMFIEPLRMLALGSGAVLSKDHIDSLFCNWEDIVRLCCSVL